MPHDSPPGGSLPLVLVALSGFVLAFLSAFLPRTLGWVLVAVALLGALAAAALVGRRQAGVLRALAVGAGPAAGAGIAGVLLSAGPIREVPFHVGSGLALGLCAVLVGFAVGAADARLSGGAPPLERHELAGFVALVVVGAVLAAVTAPYAAVHLPDLAA